MATGCLSVPKEIDIAGTDRFTGAVYLTSRWPHEGVDFTGMRVAVIGTGSSAIQSIPVIAQQAARPHRVPAHAELLDPGPATARSSTSVMAQYRKDRDAFREMERWSAAGVAVEPAVERAGRSAPRSGRRRTRQGWESGGIVELPQHLHGPHADIRAATISCPSSCANKIRSIVNDPETAEALCPKAYPIGTKRLCVDTGYYATYNLPHVRLVDIRKHPISTITEKGVGPRRRVVEFDAIVFATGFDAMTGAMVNVDITGRDGADAARTPGSTARGPTSA